MFVGRENGYKILLGTNFDFAQNFFRLKTYLDKNNINFVYSTENKFCNCNISMFSSISNFYIRKGKCAFLFILIYYKISFCISCSKTRFF